MSKNKNNLKKKKNMNKKGLIAGGIALALAGGLAFGYFRKSKEVEEQLLKRVNKAKNTPKVVQEPEKELLTIEKAVENLEASRKNLIAASTVKTFQEKGQSDSRLLGYLIKLCNGSQAEVEDLCEKFEDKDNPIKKEAILDLYIQLDRSRDRVLRMTYEDRKNESSFEIMSNTLDTMTEVDELLTECGIINAKN